MSHRQKPMERKPSMQKLIVLVTHRT